MKPGFQNNKNVSKLPMISKGDTLNLSYFGQQCERTEPYDVVYECCDSCNVCHRETKREDKKIKLYEDIGEKVIRHGVTNTNAFGPSQYQWCSACPNGIGQPM